MMDIFSATMLAEGCFDLAGYAEDDVTEDVVREAWQMLVDTGVVWTLQGTFGRTARDLIDNGFIHAAAAKT